MMKDDTCDCNPPRDKLQVIRTKTGSQVADQKYKSKTSLSPQEPESEKESFRSSEDVPIASYSQEIHPKTLS